MRYLLAILSARGYYVIPLDEGAPATHSGLCVTEIPRQCFPALDLPCFCSSNYSLRGLKSTVKPWNLMAYNQGVSRAEHHGTALAVLKEVSEPHAGGSHRPGTDQRCSKREYS